ncbi:hypothetical protein BJV78DRAFT_1291930 [Lactifluus subvellereus]|nr:hypothetical protein BJV78DRAFT_1291930 [Lactifluus subvellereus]
MLKPAPAVSMAVMLIDTPVDGFVKLQHAPQLGEFHTTSKAPPMNGNDGTSPNVGNARRARWRRWSTRRRPASRSCRRTCKGGIDVGGGYGAGLGCRAVGSGCRGRTSMDSESANSTAWRTKTGSCASSWCIRRRIWGGVDEYGVGIDEYGVGVDEYGFGVDEYGVGVDEYVWGGSTIWVGIDEYGVGVDEYGFGIDEYGVGVDEYGVGVDEYGFGVDEYGVGVDEYGFGIDEYGFGVDEYGFGVDEYGYVVWAGDQESGGSLEDAETSFDAARGRARAACVKKSAKAKVAGEIIVRERSELCKSLELD